MALPEPEAGLVISYSYLWRNEFRQGNVEGLKNRPCAIVLVVENDNLGNKVTLAPITHSEPLDSNAALEIPPKIKAHLGLDTERSWIILDDFNEFIWPGYDLRPIRGKSGRYDYGFLPPLFLKQIISKILDLRSQSKSITSRN